MLISSQKIETPTH